jgi:hypothetical protein
MGDGGWLWSLAGRTLANNYVGDTHWLVGEVISVQDEGGLGAVTLQLEARNQHGEVTCDGEAVVLLPRPGHDHIDDDALARRSEALAEIGPVGDDR